MYRPLTNGFTADPSSDTFKACLHTSSHHWLPPLISPSAQFCSSALTVVMPLPAGGNRSKNKKKKKFVYAAVKSDDAPPQPEPKEEKPKAKATKRKATSRASPTPPEVDEAVPAKKTDAKKRKAHASPESLEGEQMPVKVEAKKRSKPKKSKPQLCAECGKQPARQDDKFCSSSCAAAGALKALFGSADTPEESTATTPASGSTGKAEAPAKPKAKGRAKTSGHSAGARDASRTAGKSPAPPSIQPIRTVCRRKLAEEFAKRVEQDEEVSAGLKEGQLPALATAIEEALFEFFSRRVTSFYKSKMRMILGNVGDRKNDELWRKVITGRVSPVQLAAMSQHAMASAAVQRARQAKLAEASAQTTRKDEPLPLMISMSKPEEMDEAQLRRHFGGGDGSSSSASSGGESDEEVPAPAVTGTGPENKGLVAVKEETIDSSDGRESTSSHTVSRTSSSPAGTTDEPAALVAGSTPAATGDAVTDGPVAAPAMIRPVPKAPKPISSLRPIHRSAAAASAAASAAHGAVTTTAVTASAPGAPTIATSSSPAAAREAVVWGGTVAFASLADVSMEARRLLGQVGNKLEGMLPRKLVIQGRIQPASVWEYIEKLTYSTTKEVLVLRLDPMGEEDRVNTVSLFTYFHSRKRCGVLAQIDPSLKDAYVVPVSKSDGLPSGLQSLGLEGPGLPDDPGRGDILLAVLVRQVRKRPSGSDGRAGRANKRSRGRSSPTDQTSPTSPHLFVTSPVYGANGPAAGRGGSQSLDAPYVPGGAATAVDAPYVPGGTFAPLAAGAYPREAA